MFFALLFGLAYLIAPTMLVWGWVRWSKDRPRSWTLFSALSFVGFGIATASALYAIWIILYAGSNGFGTAFDHYAPDYDAFYRCVVRGMILSLVGTVFAICGIFRCGPVRWQAPASAVGTLAFWLLATTWP
jgi:hypothetical protein